MNPFRAQSDLEGQTEAPPDAVRDAVNTMVGQFADPFAFLRELVQNSLDAGASTIDVKLRYDPPENKPPGTMNVTVTDDGSGMTPDTITRCLLVLFRSSKEGDNSKIGRFGVGFFSVFAAHPEKVTVETGDGTNGWRLELNRDYTYELSTTTPRKGTTVTLRIAHDREGARDFALRADRALTRWCPHVRAALCLATIDVFGDGRETDRRVDTPFDIDARVKVRFEDPGQEVTLVAATSEEPRVMFFKRGILLYESTRDALPGAAVKIESPALHHTLSRDDIKRDGAWERAMALARKTAQKPLREAVLKAFTDAVTQHLTRRETNATNATNATYATYETNETYATYATHTQSEPGEPIIGPLARVIAQEHWGFDADEVPLPFVQRVEGMAAALPPGKIRPRRAPRLYAATLDPLVQALTARKIPVVDLGAAGNDPGALKDLFKKLDPRAEPAHERFVAPCERPPRDDSERQLLNTLSALLDRPVAFGDPVGALSGRLGFATDPKKAVVDIRAPDAFKLREHSPVVLSRSHPASIGALSAMKSDPVLAALILARSALLDFGVIDEARDAELTRRALTMAVT